MLTATREAQFDSRFVPLETNRTAAVAHQADARRAFQSTYELLELVDAFLHEVNGSLFVAAEFSELLAEGAEGELTPGQQRLLQVIHDRTYTVHDVLESLHSAVKLSEGRFEYSPGPCSIQKLLDLSLTRLLRRARSRIGELRVDVIGKPNMMRCDPNAASLILVDIFFHISRYLDSSHSLTLEVEQLATGTHNTCRFIVDDGSFNSAGPAVHAGDHAYFDLAVAIAEESECVVFGVDAGRRQLAGLAIPVIDEDQVSHGDRSIA